MLMAEYINRVDLVLKLDWDNDIQKWTLRDEDLDDITTITDVPRVVRCKDCKFFQYGDYCCGDKMEHSHAREDDFCSYGERKDGDIK